VGTARTLILALSILSICAAVPDGRLGQPSNSDATRTLCSLIWCCLPSTIKLSLTAAAARHFEQQSRFNGSHQPSNQLPPTELGDLSSRILWPCRTIRRLVVDRRSSSMVCCVSCLVTKVGSCETGLEDDDDSLPQCCKKTEVVSARTWQPGVENDVFDVVVLRACEHRLPTASGRSSVGVSKCNVSGRQLRNCMRC
jgi:hypothetical protein